MDRQWYLSRDGQVFGPVTDAQLAQSAAAGRILPTDQLNIAGQPNWLLASTVPGLFPTAPSIAAIPVPAPAPEPETVEEILELDSAPEPIPIDEVVELKTIRVTCFACFRELTLEIEPGTQTAHCPKCRSAIETGEPAPSAGPSAPEAAFGNLESKKAFKERMQKKVAAAHAGAARDGAIAGGILGAIIASGN